MLSVSDGGGGGVSEYSFLEFDNFLIEISRKI